MFHHLSVLLTAATVLAHAALGCCWHSHVPGGEACCGPLVCADHSGEQACQAHPARAGEACHQHGEPPFAPAETPPATPAGECGHGECSYVLSESPLLKVDSSLHGGWTTPVLLHTKTTELAGVIQLAASDARCGPLGSHAEPARARARLMVWVI